MDIVLKLTQHFKPPPLTMSNTTNGHQSPPHIALFPSAGMGHLAPFLRLAAMLASRKCTVTIITAQPTVSAAESAHITSFFSNHPHINQLMFQILPYVPPDPTTADPFFVQFEAIIRSTHLLRPLLSSLSPPLSAIFSDITVAAALNKLNDDLCIPNYIVCTTSARFFSLMVYVPFLLSEATTNSNLYNAPTVNYVEIPGIAPIPVSTIPPSLFIPSHPLTAILVSNAPYFYKAKGIMLNSFSWFEPESIDALNGGKVVPNLPQVFPIGPLEPHHVWLGHDQIPWLDEQPAESVVYVSFGSRTTMSKDQIMELGNGLEASGHRFLWVLKSSVVDKEEKQELVDLIGDSFIEKNKNMGRIVKGWVNQEMVLGHPAIGSFISHCGWNSVMEAALNGVPVLAWPQHGDQKVNAEVVEKAGLGLWEKDWGWQGEKLVKGEEVAKKVTEVMGDKNLKTKANKVGEEAREALKVGGSSEKSLIHLIETLKPKEC